MGRAAFKGTAATRLATDVATSKVVARSRRTDDEERFHFVTLSLIGENNALPSTAIAGGGCDGSDVYGRHG